VIMADNPCQNEIPETAALYSLGKLPPEQARQFERQLASGCAFCSTELRACEQVASSLPFALNSLTPPASLRNRVLALAKPIPEPVLPEGALVVRANENPWTPLPIPGVQYRQLKGKDTVLLRMEPGASYPMHEHHKAEQCLVLEGSVSSDGLTVHAGDYTYMPLGSTHHPLYSDTGCLLLIAYSA
jgi:mannose-6-phosphate isomerase-like protein (cupin superfamily)